MSCLSFAPPEAQMRVACCEMLDKLIHIADGDAALVYLFSLRQGREVSLSEVERALGLPRDRAERALFTLGGLLTPTARSTPAKASPEAPPRYTIDELRRARCDDVAFGNVCDSAELLLGAGLTESQLRILYTSYDHWGLSAQALVELLSYLKEEKGIIRNTELRREAAQWADLGIHTAQDAEQHIASLTRQKPLLDALYRALLADPAQPTAKEQRLCAFALSHGFAPDAIELAVCRTERQHGRKSLDYTLGILRRWHEKGVHTVSEITSLEPETREKAPAAGVAMPASAQTLRPGQAQPTDPSTLCAWEQEWLERVRSHRDRQENGA